jgi:hypothetical protein
MKNTFNPAFFADQLINIYVKETPPKKEEKEK